MSKQKSAIAGAVGLVVTVILTAIGLNVGILGATSDEAAPASTVPDTTWATTSTVPSTTTTTTVLTEPRIVTVYVDEVVPGAPIAEAQASSAPTSPPSAASAAPAPAPAPASKSPTPKPAPAPASKAPTPKAPTAAPSAPAAPAPAPATSPPAAPAASYPKYDVPGIGTVTLQHADGKIHFWAASTSNGWQYRVEKDGSREVDVEFRAGGGDEEDEREAKFKAQLENGQIRVRTEMDD